jgi:hypothetical protein
LTEYICVGHANEEEDSGEDEDSSEDEDSDEENDPDEQENPQNQSENVAGKPASEFPEWKWIFTRSAVGLHAKWDLEDQKRDQDSLGCHFFNDFTGYGQHENLENMVQAAYNEFTKKPFDIDRYWTHVQAIGLYLHEAGLVPWNSMRKHHPYEGNPLTRWRSNR